jgi:hypothetical protein
MTDFVRGFAMRARKGSTTGANKEAPIPAAKPVTILLLKKSDAIDLPSFLAYEKLPLKYL